MKEMAQVTGEKQSTIMVRITRKDREDGNTEPWSLMNVYFNIMGMQQ